MKAIELAKLEAAILASDIEEGPRDVLLEWLAKDRDTRLRQGRRHLSICNYIEARLEEGRSLPYCFDTAASLYALSSDTVRGIWGDFRENSRITPVAAVS